jgi:hypothetical protein
MLGCAMHAGTVCSRAALLLLFCRFAAPSTTLRVSAYGLKLEARGLRPADLKLEGATAFGSKELIFLGGLAA